ncbi:double-strand break repair protein AddB [Rhizobium sp. TRM96647]|uniref:double-strand break repair protein AddB n=1 Tax=unclassified Rhizobium TaxID=2613769 RepID=UPI0021E86403|nr:MULTISPECIES: double-strand break repair protein AddB [unclassified Rhizobium]MCV3735113.1 double-strand break repair protein AddB [Rhizobium sp. TRM96647]MCV3757483.1 double-strand break repair protein AddB [Rhizobium sp. TRM96650]
MFSIHPGLPFLKTLARRICDGTIIPGFRHDDSDPLSLADMTIYVPTRRSARSLRSEFVDLLGGRSAILPVIRPLGETDDDSGFFDEVAPAALDMAEPLSGPARLLELAQLVLAWRNSLPAAITAVHAESPLVAPASPADAIWLARELAELIDAMETEECDWDALKTIEAADHAQWWQLTLAFLKIASEYWPARLDELNRSSPSIRRNATLHAEADRYRDAPPSGPVVIAGSTGSIPATARLIEAVAGMPNGAVVLPGLDFSMSDEDWRLVTHDPLSGEPSREASNRSHPQYGLSRLLRRLGLERSMVVPLGTPEAALATRAELLSRALLPVHATAGWEQQRHAMQGDQALVAFAGACLVEAANEREEATAIAVALRLALEEGEESQAALITPDRKLARRVAAELARFGIEADDSAGTPLLATPQGTLTRLLLEAALRPGDPVALVALLKHPLACFGLPAEKMRAGATALELLALRGGTAEVDISTLEPLLYAALKRQATDRKPPEWRTAIPEASVLEARELARRIATAVEPLAGVLVRHGRTGRRFTTALPIAEWAERTGRALEAVAIDEHGNLAGLWSGEAGDGLASLLKGVIEAEGQLEADGPQWCDVLAAISASETVKPRSMRHPRVFIFGALESRLQSVDTIVIGGLNEGTWPGQTTNDAFLSRAMKAGIGLEPPERRIGQLAHDFQVACAARKLVLTRATRSGTSPTVASRWLQRLLAVGGPSLAQDLRKRGADLLHWTALLDRRQRQPAAKRPEPRPPAELQPKSYSFSEVGRLRRDPYAIYARRILRLHPIAPFNVDPGAAERGTLYHRIVDRYVREHAGERADGELMSRITTEEFDRMALPLHIDAVWRPRFRAVANAFLAWDGKRRQALDKSLTEVSASLDLGIAGMRLTGVADRIDLRSDGRGDLIDYKTGSSPSLKIARALLDPQLPLEAAALKRGAFRDLPSMPPGDLTYVRLKPGDRFDDEVVNNEHARPTKDRQPKSAEDLADDALLQLEKLLAQLLSGHYGFASRVIPEAEREFGGEYDHLARVAEWSTAEGSEGDEDA